MGISISNQGACVPPVLANGGAADVVHANESVGGPHIGWNPTVFRKLGGFAGGIRSVSGAFRDRHPGEAILRSLHRDLERRHQWMMRFVKAGDDHGKQEIERRSFRYFDAIYRWAFYGKFLEVSFPRDIAEGLVHLFNHRDVVGMAFAVWDSKISAGDRMDLIHSIIMDGLGTPTMYVLHPISNLVKEGGLTGAAALAALTHLSGYGIWDAIVGLRLLGGDPSTAPIFMHEGAVSIEALQVLDGARRDRTKKREAGAALAATHLNRLELLGEFNAEVDEGGELRALVEDARGWCQEFGRRLDNIDEQTRKCMLSDLSISFEDSPLNDQAMKALAEAAKVSHRAYCYLRIFAEHASNEAAKKYFKDPAYAASFKTSLEKSPDGGNE